MCGIIGIHTLVGQAYGERFCWHGTKLMSDRGPDGSGVQIVGPNLTFGHARLSIIDPTGGSQPMRERDNWISFNGEVYNYKEIAASLGIHSNSDTAVLLNLLSRKGIQALNDLDGMFAFAFYDRQSNRLYLARDRFGIKPLYYITGKRNFAFASTLPPLMPLSGGEIDQQAVLEYYLYRAARAPRTVFKDVCELPAGHVLTFSLESARVVSIESWVFPAQREVEPFSSFADAKSGVVEALRKSVRRHLVSDVPVASFLSGGVDSSLVTALAVECNPNLTAFSIGFHDSHFDESPFARLVAEHLKIRHEVEICSANEFEDALEDWAEKIDDPVADPSAVFLYRLARFTRENGFKVAIGGEGADEMFGGYNQYRRYALSWSMQPFCRALSFLVPLVEEVFPEKTRTSHYLRMFTRDPGFRSTSMIFEPHVAEEILEIRGPAPVTATNIRAALDMDIRNRLPDDILCRTDRATMAGSVEARVPFLTSYLHDTTLRIPSKWLVHGGSQKRLLKKCAEAFVPRECVWRRKVGFDLPLSSWYRTSMRARFQDVFSSTFQRDFFARGALQRIATQHLGHHANHADKIFAIILLEENVKAMRAYGRLPVEAKAT